ncbi:putative transcriptional regulator, PucR family [Kribbella flavida DSM 17836]|uniref:Putative transcriptional regulator, PucR family n=1 Tax=Kribbella flavida (strain DSM 17836 / JCM 10339 / NBRC 14399) TaxID=479435 RepID=D2Q1Z0_KRIFD|nr:PucR family transcriptional regulator [Kribbella flavida]ADB33936.1 putative transcriptional regulator, PucR family [Kribbella flavida DSM 17836]
MTNRPRASLGRVLDDLGATLLELLHGDPDLPVEIGGVVTHDPVDEPPMPRHALVLGVGLRDPLVIAALLRELGAQQAAGLVVRVPLLSHEAVTSAVADSGVALLGLTRGASWDQLGVLLRSLLADGDVGVAGADTLGGMPAGDLFALANAAAALLDAPVTIEDRSSRVLAFSGRQDEADTARVETILGRQVPQRFSRILAEQGIFRELYRTDRPVYVPPLPATENEFTIPRMAVAVRAGDEILGSIWAAVHGPLSEERSQALRDAAKLVAMHMLRIRAGADVERRLRADLVSTALEGGAGAREALNRLGLADQPVAVLALGISELAAGTDFGDAGLVTERQRLADAFAMHLGAVHPRSAAALVGDVAYGLIPVHRDRTDGEARAVRLGTDFLDRIGDRVTAQIGVGPVVQDAFRLPHAREGADRALRVLRAGRGTQRVARMTDVHVEALVLELRDLVAARGDQPTGPVARLFAYDAQHNTNLVETLRAWLDAFGDVIAAAASLYVHPNTFRYRLRRLAEVGELDLDDPEARFAAMLQLRVVAPPPPPTSAS